MEHASQFTGPDLPQEALKGVAALSMLLDHAGLVLFPGAPWLRYLGRVAFPIYCFFLAQGARLTSHWGRYLGRLLAMALVSEAAFDRMVYGRLFSLQGQNVLWTLALGLLAIRLLDSAGLPGLVGAAACCLAAEALKTDYGAFGVCLCLLCRVCRSPARAALGFVLLCLAFPQAPIPGTRIPMEVFGVLAFPLLSMYHGRRWSRRPALRWAFYWFYPVHMLLIRLLGSL